MRNVHIIVKRCMGILVFVEEPVSVVDAEIFKMQETMRVVLAH